MFAVRAKGIKQGAWAHEMPPHQQKYSLAHAPLTWSTMDEIAALCASNAFSGRCMSCSIIRRTPFMDRVLTRRTKRRSVSPCSLPTALDASSSGCRALATIGRQSQTAPWTRQTAGCFRDGASTGRGNARRPLASPAELGCCPFPAALTDSLPARFRLRQYHRKRKRGQQKFQPAASIGPIRRTRQVRHGGEGVQLLEQQFDQSSS